MGPGNVRELKNLVQRALVLRRGPNLTLEELSVDLTSLRKAGPREQAREIERKRLQQALLDAGGNCARAARALGIPRTTFSSRARKHGLI